MKEQFEVFRIFDKCKENLPSLIVVTLKGNQFTQYEKKEKEKRAIKIVAGCNQHPVSLYPPRRKSFGNGDPVAREDL